MSVLRKALVFSLVYGSLCIAASLILAPLSVVILGPSFEGTQVYVKLLCLLLPFKFAQWYIGDALTSVDRQANRTMMQLLAAGATALLLWMLVPPTGVIGALVATFVVEVGFTVALYLAIYRSGLKLSSPPRTSNVPLQDKRAIEGPASK